MIMNMITSYIEHCICLVGRVVRVMGVRVRVRVGVRVQGRGEGEGKGALRRHFQGYSSGRGHWNDEVILYHLHCQVVHLTGEAGGDLGENLLWMATRPVNMATDHTHTTH